MTGHAFTSELTVGEHHAIRSVGFSPVGQVLGSCVYHVGYTRSVNCGYNRRLYDNRQLDGIRSADERNRELPPVAVPDVNAATVKEADDLRQARYEARMLAVTRLLQECIGLGGDGVVAVTLTDAPFPAGGLEFKAIGTAVRAAGTVRPSRPFLSDLSGKDFAKLMVAGWVPCGFVLGVGVTVRHDDFRTEMQQRSWYNAEITGRTKLVNAARRAARKQLRADCARHGGDGVVVRASTLRIWGQRCRSSGEGHDHLAEAIFAGTAVTQFRRGAPQPPPLKIMRLR